MCVRTYVCRYIYTVHVQYQYCSLALVVSVSPCSRPAEAAQVAQAQGGAGGCAESSQKDPWRGHPKGKMGQRYANRSMLLWVEVPDVVTEQKHCTWHFG